MKRKFKNHLIDKDGGYVLLEYEGGDVFSLKIFCRCLNRIILRDNAYPLVKIGHKKFKPSEVLEMTSEKIKEIYDLYR